MPGVPSQRRAFARRRSAARALVLGCVASLAVVPLATAAVPQPVWDVNLAIRPTNVIAGQSASIAVSPENIGNRDTDSPVSVTVDVPTGMTIGPNPFDFTWDCPNAVGASSITCIVRQGNWVGFDDRVLGHTATRAPLIVNVDVAPGTTSLGSVQARVTGGGAAAPATASRIPPVGADAMPFSVVDFRGRAINADGTPARQAGDHPDVTTSFEFPTKVGPEVVDNMKDVDVELPPGLVGNPLAAPACSVDDLFSTFNTTLCKAEAQVGVVTLVRADGTTELPVYNLVPPSGVAARFGFQYTGVLTFFDATVRADGDYSIIVKASGISQSLAVVGSKVTLWGVPADPLHDAARFAPNDVGVPVAQVRGVPSTTPRIPFITTPTECSGHPLVTRISAVSWSQPDNPQTGSFDTNFDGSPLLNEGCDRLPFTPTVSVVPTTTQPDAPTGLDVEIDSPQNLSNPDGLASAHLRDVKVTLPEGMTINPGSADGLGACSDAQLSIGSAAQPTCPDSAKIGTVTAKSPVLAEELSGGVYLRSQASDDPGSGAMFRMALVLANAERGILVKLPGAIRVDASTGRIVTEFDNNPQLPVEQVKLSLKSGPRSPLATPPTCGTKTVTTDLTSWSGKTANASSSFTVPCATGLGGFVPTLTAGTTNPVGGAFSPFALKIAKPDGNAPISGLSMKLPTGLLAQLKGNIGTQVGTVTAFAGPGSNPYALPGRVYLEGAYGDAPFSLRVVVPAKAGPFDLGTVEVKQKIYVDPVTAQVTVVSDPLPTIVKGVPVRLQRLDVDVDKAGFIINPTSCAPKAFTGTMSAVDGQTAPINVRFQVGSCASLGYTPKLAMTMSGKGQTKDGSHPALTARLTPPAGDANSKQVTVTLPLSLALDPGNANGLCEPVDAAKNQCGANTIVGSAQAQSILPDTLKAPVYFVRGERLDSKGMTRKTLPKLFIPLTANGVTVYIWGNSNVDHDRLVTTFDNLPDAPFSTFDLTINGGKHGILAVSNTNTCAVTNVADAQYTGQNGKSYTSRVTMGTPCALGVVKSSRTATALKLTIGGVGAGKLSASGNGVAKAATTIAGATTATLSLKLAKATHRALARGRDVKVKVKVAFTAKGQKKAKTATKTVTIHGTKKR